MHSMTNAIPKQPKIYHIIHHSKLLPIIEAGLFWCDVRAEQQNLPGTKIGMAEIKQRRQNRTLHSYPDLSVAACVPFYFCPRSVMLYMIHRANHENLAYRDGQEPIIHLEADFHSTITWANEHRKRWVFTNANAATSYSEDYCNLNQLGEINWQAVRASIWNKDGLREGKQAEFLIEECLPWHLVERIGVCSSQIHGHVRRVIHQQGQQIPVQIMPKWYY